MPVETPGGDKVEWSNENLRVISPEQRRWLVTVFEISGAVSCLRFVYADMDEYGNLCSLAFVWNLSTEGVRVLLN